MTLVEREDRVLDRSERELVSTRSDPFGRCEEIAEGANAGSARVE